MSRQLAVKCDECGQVKGETNHWLVCILKLDNTIIISNLDNTNGAEALGLHDLCGRQCAIQFVSKAMVALC